VEQPPAAQAKPALPPSLSPPPASMRRALPLREQTGPHLLGNAAPGSPPLPRAEQRNQPADGEIPSVLREDGLGRQLVDTAPARSSLLEDDEEPGTARIPFSPSAEPDRPLTGERLSPLATVLLVAGIVLVLALMFLLVFRSA